MTRYELMDHTADFGLRVFGQTLADLFHDAAMALFEQIADRNGRAETSEGSAQRRVEVEGEDLADIMVNWLRELLFLWNGEEFLVTHVDILSISERRLSATVRVEPFNPAHHLILNEIKAATYHGILVEKRGGEWVAEVIFDV